MDDHEVIVLCQEGDADAFRCLVEKYGSVLKGTAYLMTRDAALAEELVQDAFVSAWRGIRGFKNGRPIKPWLVRILVNRVLGKLRAGRQMRSKRATRRTEGSPSSTPSTGRCSCCATSRN